MAEAIFRHLGKDIIDVKSAGSNPSGVNPFVYKVIGEIGVSTEGLFSKNVTQFLDENKKVIELYGKDVLGKKEE